MRVPVRIPPLTPEAEVAEIEAWVKQVGQPVAEDEVVVEVLADKATIEVGAPASGTLVEIVHGPGDEVRPGDVVAFIDTGG
jgi:2-oxoglutarate dehydrogenase E2 component (dihydrolipoamide succinyltransferase)